MHILIGLLTATAGLFWALDALQRSGALETLNPFLWYRRAQWNKKYRKKPIYSLDNPIDVAAVLLLGTAKCEGEISSEQKREILEIFENEFHLTSKVASDLLLSSSHLMKDEDHLVDNLQKVLEQSGSMFSEEQIDSVLSLMRRVSGIENPMDERQRQLIQATETCLAKVRKNQNTWRS